jgi:hypothetical protein
LYVLAKLTLTAPRKRVFITTCYANSRDARRAIFIGLRQLTGPPEVSQLTCQSRTDRGFTEWKPSFLLRSPGDDWPIGRSLFHGIVDFVGTRFVGRFAVFEPNPRLPTRFASGRLTGQRELVRAAAVLS